MKDNLLNILTVPGTPIRSFSTISESTNTNFAKLYPFRCESQDDLSQLNKSTSQNSFEKNNIYP